MSKRLSMRKIQEILRLSWEMGRSHREISISVGVSTSTVSECLRRAKKAGLKWPLPEGMNEGQIEQLLYPSTHLAHSSLASLARRPQQHA